MIKNFNKTRKTPLNFKNSSELDIMRKYKKRSDKNFCVEKGFYPLGSCTMKYNPRVNEKLANLEKFLNIHPYQKDCDVQGALKIMYNLQEALKKVTGMDDITLQPKAGAHGEFCGMAIIKKYFEQKGELAKRTKVIIPDSAHGTNPASAHMSGFDVICVKSNSKGLVDTQNLKEVLNEDVAAIMMTNPNTLGLFEENIKEISDLAHKNGSLLYYDGANLNAIMGKTTPSSMGFDVVHLNLHKTFSTPHGTGGPGAGPVAVKEKLAEFLPVPKIVIENGKYKRDYNHKNSIGKVSAYFGNFSVLVRAYSYILLMGRELKQASEDAVLNANYLKEKLKKYYDLPFKQNCMHEFVLTNEFQKNNHISTLQIAKRLMDYDIHPPTIYFPQIVHEAIMIEPTESESIETLDNFVEIMEKIAREAKDNPKEFANYPLLTPVLKVDEVAACRNLDLRAK